MIKASALTRDGVPVLLLGLDTVELRGLVAGRPLTVDAQPYCGTALRVILTGGTSPETIVDELREAGLTVLGGRLYPLAVTARPDECCFSQEAS